MLDPPTAGDRNAHGGGGGGGGRKPSAEATGQREEDGGKGPGLASRGGDRFGEAAAATGAGLWCGVEGRETDGGAPAAVDVYAVLDFEATCEDRRIDGGR